MPNLPATFSAQGTVQRCHWQGLASRLGHLCASFALCLFLHRSTSFSTSLLLSFHCSTRYLTLDCFLTKF